MSTQTRRRLIRNPLPALEHGEENRVAANAAHALGDGRVIEQEVLALVQQHEDHRRVGYSVDDQARVVDLRVVAARIDLDHIQATGQRDG